MTQTDPTKSSPHRLGEAGERYLFITVDTEEDSWGDYNAAKPPVENIKRVPLFQDICERYNAIPTYLINYPVASSETAAQLLKSYLRDKVCDVGMHCHPWNTPPIEEKISKGNSFLCNISSDDLVFRKLKTLHLKIEERLGLSPTVFRAGRWGFGPGVRHALEKLGYEIDTSITPYCDWGDSGGPIFRSSKNYPYTIEAKGNTVSGDNLPHRGNGLLEIPPTIGYLQPHFDRLHQLRSLLKRRPFSQLHLLGILERLRLLNFRWLSPELSSANDMISLAKRMLEKGHSTLNMSFHSTSLLPGKSPFVKDERDLARFLDKINTFLSFCASLNIPCIGMSHATKLL